MTAAAPATAGAARIVRGLGALVVLAATLIGLPWLLLTVGRLPDPRGWTWAGFVRLWTTPDNGTVLIMVITVVAWLAWLVIALSSVLELITAVSRQHLRPRLPGLAGPQAVAAVLILAVATMIIAPLHAVAPLHAGAPSAPPPEPTKPTTQRVERPGPVADRIDPAAQSKPWDRAATVREHPRADSIVYTVKTGDDLWTLADRFYGDGAEWRRIAEANASKLTGGPDELVVGWRLTIPGVERAPSGERPARVTVRASDTLTVLAERHYGDPLAWRMIFDANRDVVDDPDQIDVGWVLRLPSTDPATGSGDDRVDRTPPPAESPGPPKPSGDAPEPGADPPEQAPDEPVTPTPSTEPRPTSPPAEVPERRAPTEVPQPTQTQPTQTRPSRSSEGVPAAAIEGEADAAGIPADTVAVGAVGGLLAASLVAGVLARREWQLLNRPVGRRIPHPPLPAQQLEVALARQAEPLTLASLDLVLRAIARHCQVRHLDVPTIELVLAGPEQIELRIAGTIPPPPVGFTSCDTGWLVDRDSQSYLESVPAIASAPRLWPALISVGRTPRGSYVLVNLEAAGLFALRPPGSTGTSGLGDYGASRTDDDLVTAVLTAVAMELSFSYWSGDLRVTAVGHPREPAPDWLDALALYNITWSTDADQVIERAAVRAAAQRSLVPSMPLGNHRLDLATADAWTPELLVFTRPLRPDQLTAAERVLLDGSPVSLAAVVVDAPGAVPPPRRARPGRGLPAGDWALELAREPEPAWLAPVGIELAPQRVELDIRTSLVELVATTGRQDTDPAPWWPGPDTPGGAPVPTAAPYGTRPPSPAAPIANTGPTASTPSIGNAMSPVPGGSVTFLGSRRSTPAEPSPTGIPEETAPVILPDQTPTGTSVTPTVTPTVTPSPPVHPIVRLLGPIDLVGAGGPLPSRAARQCVEYCAWLLEHPGATAVAMADALCVAEGTRRSNTSRLRSWLGEGPDGQPYLPDAYSGRIFLDPMVSSDWLRLRLLVGAGVNRAGAGALAGALELVPGAPLADAAPGQWYWAEELRTDMVSMIRDIGVQLARTALAEKDIDLARWAAARALAAAPGDELLMCERIRTEHRAGNPHEVERLVLQVQGRARSLGIDLTDDTVDVMQRVLEGTVRARQA